MPIEESFGLKSSDHEFLDEMKDIKADLQKNKIDLIDVTEVLYEDTGIDKNTSKLLGNTDITEKNNLSELFYHTDAHPNLMGATVIAESIYNYFNTNRSLKK